MNNLWNLLDLVSLTLSYMMIISWIIYISSPFLADFRNDPESYQIHDTIEDPDEIIDGFDIPVSVY